MLDWIGLLSVAIFISAIARERCCMRVLNRIERSLSGEPVRRRNKWQSSKSVIFAAISRNAETTG